MSYLDLGTQSPTAKTESLDKPRHTLENIFHKNAKVLQRQHLCSVYICADVESLIWKV